MNTKTFQIEQKYSDNCGGYIYFDVPENSDLKDIELKAIKTTIKDWDSINPALYFSFPKPCRPTIYVYEYKDGNRVKGGVKFKTKWR